MLVSTRLNDIRDAVGLEASSHDEPQRQGLPKVHDWLKKASARTVLEASQVLFVEGDLELPAVHRAAKPVRDLLTDEWGNLAKPAQRMLALKVLVLAAWDTKAMCTGPYRVLALAASPLWTPTRQLALRPYLEEALRELSVATITNPDDTWSTDAAKAAPPKFDANSFPEALKAEISAPPLQPGAQEKLGATLSLHASTIASLRASIEAVRTVTLGLPPVIDAKLSKLASSVDIIWWGQTRYCEYQRKPFRQLSSAASKRWWAALGLSERANANYVESAASFLVETLLSLGVAADETRTLGEWLEELHDTLKRDQRDLPRMRDQIVAHVTDCAVGLPVTWVRTHANDPFNSKLIEEATTLDLSQPLHSWQWTSWLLRECMLEELLGD